MLYKTCKHRIFVTHHIKQTAEKGYPQNPYLVHHTFNGGTMPQDNSWISVTVKSSIPDCPAFYNTFTVYLLNVLVVTSDTYDHWSFVPGFYRLLFIYVTYINILKLFYFRRNKGTYGYKTH